MNNSTLLLIDVSNLAYRAFHTTGDLSFEGIKTGVVYGLFRDVLILQELYQTKRIAFCFDGGCRARRNIFPGYKFGRRRESMDEEEIEARDCLYRQIDLLRTDYLSAIGFRNVFCQSGYEADDVIASICKGLPAGDRATIVSTDADLYQLLVCSRIDIWNPQRKKPITENSFRSEHGISPTLWAQVKAIAGCSGDGVPGFEGVGEKTAIKFLLGSLKPESKAFKKIVTGYQVRERNLKLVLLPFPGTEKFEIKTDEVTEKRWDWMLNELSMKKLRDRAVGVRNRKDEI